MYIIGQLQISGGYRVPPPLAPRALAHLPGPSIGPRFSLIQFPCDVTALCLATPRGICRTIRRPPDSGIGIDSGCSSLELGFAAAGPINLSGLLHSGANLWRRFSLGDRKPNIGRKCALLAGLTTSLYNVTLTLFEDVPLRREGPISDSGKRSTAAR